MVKEVAGFSRTQIALHWSIAVLVLIQFLNGEAMEDYFDKIEHGRRVVSPSIFAEMHIYLGILILILAVLRIALRLLRGTPKAPSGESEIQKLIASVVHWSLYAGIFLVPLSGLAAWQSKSETIGEVHEALQGALMFVVAVHIAGALFQHFVLRSDVLKRILKPE